METARPVRVAGRVTTARNKLGTLANAHALAELGFKAQQISALTNASMPDIRDIQELLGLEVNDKGGRKHRSIATLLESTRRHVESSIFLRSYDELIREFFNGGRGVRSTDALIVAFRHLRSLIPKAELLPEQAIMIADAFHNNEVDLARCSHSRKCPGVFLVSVEPLTLRQHVTTGECPICRELYLTMTGKSVVKIPDTREMRELLSRHVD